jgi:flagellar basal body-associated protein FliL
MRMNKPKQKQNKKNQEQNKKKKILLSTLIPLGCLVVTTAIVVPIVLTQCNNKDYQLTADRTTLT